VLDLLTATGDVTLTLSNAVGGGSYVIKIVQGATTARNVIWPATVKWPGGVTPVITATLSAVGIVSLLFDGTNYYASIVQALS